MTAMTKPQASGVAGFDVARIRQDFPILSQEVYGKPLVFLDSGASAQKPRQVMQAMVEMTETAYANVHRGIHAMSQRATDRFEAARETVARFLGTPDDTEIVFTRNATEAINLVAASFLHPNLAPGDEIVVSEMEHHANIVPWQLVAAEKGAVVRPCPVLDDGALDLDALDALIGPRTKLVAVAHVSNVLGTVNLVAEVAALAHAKGVPVLLDGAQAVAHGKVDVRALDVDFYAFTGHKLYGPTGIGVLYGKRALLDAMPPYQGGGEMIDKVSFAGSTFKEPPHRFEAGTPAIIEAVGLAAAIDYVEAIGFPAIAAHEASLREAAMGALGDINSLRILGTRPDKAAIVSFVVEGVHSLDLAALMDRDGVAVRVGHHCAEPLMARFGLDSTVRASFGLYNTLDEVEALAASIRKAITRLS